MAEKPHQDNKGAGLETKILNVGVLHVISVYDTFL